MTKRKSLLHSVTIFETGLSAAEWLWRILTLLVIGGSSTATALVAKADPVLKQLGPIYWIAIALVTALVMALVLYLIKSASLKQSLAEVNRVLLNPRDDVNPLLSSFADKIISIESLRLPTTQLHENKHFRRCTFVGPATLAILGGTYARNTFNDCGDVVALPEGCYMTGVIAFKNCTVEDCEFVRISILTDQNSAKGFAQAGATVKGIS